MNNHSTEKQQSGFSPGPAPQAEALGQSEPFLQFQERLSRVAPVERPVLLLGERGTGKELAARRLHYLSHRWQGPFVTLNCAALSPGLIASELFGYEKGAFTGAEHSRKGRFEVAHGGTLFLDEIGTIPMEVQEKILRVVEYNVFERVGSAQPVEVDVRIVGATNADLPDMARRGEFKPDLLDRLSFEVLFLPPLRVRGEDVMLLAHHFAGRMAYELDLDQLPTFTEKAITALEQYSWPGNVRELKNVVERAVYAAEDQAIERVVFDPFVSPYASTDRVMSDPLPDDRQLPEPTFAPFAGLPMKEAVRRYEIGLVRRALQENQYNQRKAAQTLGLSYDQLRGQVRKHGVEALGLR